MQVEALGHVPSEPTARRSAGNGPSDGIVRDA